MITMQNPLKFARESLGMSQKELADYAGMTPGAVLKYEQGLYEEPSVTLVEALNELQTFVVDYKTMSKAYSLWRNNHRLGADLKPLHMLALSFKNDSHPLVQYRRAVGLVSAQSFCVLLCLHPAVVRRYEGGKARNMPRQVKDALFLGGLSHTEISIIESHGHDYFDRVTYPLPAEATNAL